MAEVVETALAIRGHRVRVAATARAGLEQASLEEPDVVILDLGLPDGDGLEVCAQLRRWFRNPIIVLSADGAEDRKVAALDLGADDYVTKPFSMPELLARLRVATRHRELVAAALDPAMLVVGDVEIDTAARTVRIAGEPVELTRKEFELLALVARNPGKVLTHGLIFAQVWGPSGGSAESLRVHMTHLRRKLGEGPSRPALISEPGVGYRLILAETQPSH